MQQSQIQGLLAKFQDVFISDSTIVTLQDSLQKLFPGVSTKAGLQIHLMLSAKDCSPAQVKLGAAAIGFVSYSALMTLLLSW